MWVLERLKFDMELRGLSQVSGKVTLYTNQRQGKLSIPSQLA
jgi:hypothetical protein